VARQDPGVRVSLEPVRRGCHPADHRRRGRAEKPKLPERTAPPKRRYWVLLKSYHEFIQEIA
jgi:hypothetical protein